MLFSCAHDRTDRIGTAHHGKVSASHDQVSRKPRDMRTPRSWGSGDLGRPTVQFKKERSPKRSIDCDQSITSGMTRLRIRADVRLKVTRYQTYSGNEYRPSTWKWP